MGNRKPVIPLTDIKYVWPFNLAYEIFLDHQIIIPENLILALDTLYERERDVIQLYYKNGWTLQQIGDHYGVGKERIRQVKAKALRKLRNPVRSRTFMVGCSRSELKQLENEMNAIKIENAGLRDAIEQMNEGKEVILSEEDRIRNDILDKPIDTLNLSVRSYNCLTKYARRKLGCEYMSIRQLVNMTTFEVMSVRNLGAKSFHEIVDKLKELGYALKGD